MRALIAGAGNVGGYLAIELAAREHEVTLIERRGERLRRLEDRGFQVVVGDACAPEVLERAGVAEAEVVVAATGDDEDNLVICLLAKQEYAVPRTIGRTNHPTNGWLFTDAWGVDAAVSPALLLTAFVEEEVTVGDLVPLLTLAQGSVELLEVRLGASSAAVGHHLDELTLPPGATVVAVVRSGSATPVRSGTIFEQDDQLVLLAARERHAELQELLVG